MKISATTFLLALLGIFSGVVPAATFANPPTVIAASGSADPSAKPSTETVGGITFLHDLAIGQDSDYTVHVDIAYPSKPPKGLMPGIVWIHGGGWAKGKYKPNGSHWLARKGYFTASVDYRLNGDHLWPSQLQDCSYAVQWLRANADKYHVDPKHIGVWGFSAGGHLASCLGTMADLPLCQTQGAYAKVSNHVQAVINFSGPADLTQGSAGIQKAISKTPDQESPGLVHLFAGNFKEKTALWKQASPILYVKKGDPPFLIAHGDKDRTIPYEQSVNFVAALKQAGVPVEFISVSGGGHGLHAEGDNPPATPARAEINADVVAFLDKNLKP